MKDTIEENNRLRNEQLGNRSANELTKREHFAALALQGLLASKLYGSCKAAVDESVYIADLLVEKLNTKLDRDLNASKNILKEGIKISSWTDDYRRGDEIRPVLTGTIGETSKKKVLKSPETH